MFSACYACHASRRARYLSLPSVMANAANHAPLLAPLSGLMRLLMVVCFASLTPISRSSPPAMELWQSRVIFQVRLIVSRLLFIFTFSRHQTAAEEWNPLRLLHACVTRPPVSIRDGLHV